MTTAKCYDVAVIGAGVLGAWTARHLLLSGRSVIVLDAYGAANSRAGSGGETRVIRMGYGKDETYMRSSIRSLALWKEFVLRAGEELFRPTGVLWLADENNSYPAETYEALRKTEVKVERISREDLEKRFPQIALGEVAWGLYEPESGVLMARRSLQALVREALEDGAGFLQGAVQPPAGQGRLDFVTTHRSEAIHAGVFVFACGSWLPNIFPGVLGDRIFPTRQEVFFFGAPSGDSRFQPPAFPTWIWRSDVMYGIPDIENRGAKFASSGYGPPVDADTAERLVSAESVAAMREYVGRRFPALKDAPLLESRVCQYAATSSKDFLVDRHPEFSNVWLMAGAGHAFKHGPALGEYAAQRILNGGEIDPRFSLASKTGERPTF